MTATVEITSTQRVYDAVVDLHALEQVATRETVARLTGLKLTVVDDRLRALVDDQKLKRVLRGVYVPVETHPPARDISKTILSDGRVKIEIGDEVLTLTPREDRMLSSLMAGTAAQAIAIQTGNTMVQLGSDLHVLMRAAELAVKTRR
ncbi:hypothetical protein [Ideonella oryzae]|uniref:Uncharacterized protein n=1 Tax=Ideonella oryzae TaxID=2937441 RepID=A0ABT1BKQ8_9BURK|nr:hypothetical protein [Ideonella oryzae]MCO5976802.1 hypothetical protein [Ideonella oryzae]